MKKFLSVLLAVIMLFLCFAFTSCKQDVTEVQTDPSEDSSAFEIIEEAPEIVIAEGGEDVYTLIRYIDAGNDEVDLVVDFKNSLNAKYKLSFGISSDWTMPSMAPPADAPEIIIGLTCREETSEVLALHKLGYGDSAIQVCDNNKIVIVAPNYKDLTICFNYFTENLKTVTEDNGVEKIVYCGGNYIYKTESAHLWDKADGMPDFNIVYDKKGENKKYAEDIARAIKKTYQIEFDVVCETEPKSDYEIIVGILSDKSRFNYDYTKLTPLGFEIAVSENAILIAASTNTVLDNAVDAFLDGFIRTGNIVSTNLPVGMVISYNTFTGGDSDVLAEGADTRIMSFNILSEEWDSAAVLEGRDVRIPAIIFNYHPDVAALQEVSNAWYPILEDYIGDTYKFTRKKTPSGKGTYTTLIYNTQTTSLIKEDIRIYSVGNSDRLRSIAWGLFESKITGERYIVFSTHWDVGAEKASQRLTQAKEMAALAKQLSEEYNADVFACGDYNASESTTEYKTFLSEAGFVDAKTAALVKNRTCKTYHTLFQSVSTDTYESIDHITFSAATASKVLYYNTLINDYVIDASDHCPIYIDIKTKK